MKRMNVVAVTTILVVTTILDVTTILVQWHYGVMFPHLVYYALVRSGTRDLRPSNVGAPCSESLCNIGHGLQAKQCASKPHALGGTYHIILSTLVVQAI